MCDKCRSGASGEEGHSALFAGFRWGIRPDGEPHLRLYICAECGAIWGRTRRADGFAWLRKGELDCGEWRACIAERRIPQAEPRPQAPVLCAVEADCPARLMFTQDNWQPRSGPACWRLL